MSSANLSISNNRARSDQAREYRWEGRPAAERVIEDARRRARLT